MTAVASTARAAASHSALRTIAGATVLATLGGCARLPFLQPAPPVAAVEAPPPPATPHWTAPPAAPVPESDADGLERLARFAEVWHTVRWFHPDVVGRAGGWDTAYLRHVDAVREARSDEAFVAAVHGLLGELADVQTGVVRAGDGVGAGVAGGAFPAVLRVRTADNLVVVRPVAFATARERQLQQQLFTGDFTEHMPSDAAVLDLRAGSGGTGDQRWEAHAPQAEQWPRPAGSSPVAIRRTVVRDGWSALGADASCCTQWSLRTEAVAAGGEAVARSAPPSRLAVIVDDSSVVPAAILSLHASGHALFLSTGTGVLRTDASVTDVPLVAGLLARVRTEELLLPDGRPVPSRADTVVREYASVGATSPAAGSLQRPDTTDSAVAAALSLLRRTPAAAAATVREPSRLLASDGSGEVAAPGNAAAPIYPSYPERLLAVTKLWSAVRLFNPYLPMADESWDAMYRVALGDAERAGTSRTYAVALFRFAARTDASQVVLEVPDHPEFGRRTGRVPFRLRLVDRRALVAAIDDSAAERAALQVGDEIVAIGGEPIDKRLGRLRDLMPASNNWARDQQLERWLERGPATVKATFRVQRAAGEARDVEFAYAEPAGDDGMHAPGTDERRQRRVDSLGDGLWLVQLETGATGEDHLAHAGAASPSAAAERAATPAPLPEGLGLARGVIVDVRGVRGSDALRWLAGSVLDADGRQYARDAVSQLTGPPQAALRTPELDPARRFTWTARAAPEGADRFRGPMVILADATTQGDGELLVLRLAAGGPQRMVMGSTTAGAVGAVRSLSLPGGVEVELPVTDVRQPDGRFVQRLGVPPTRTVTPTVQGARAGRDELLEAARQWLQEQLAPPSRRR